MTTKHTAGPWTALQRGDDCGKWSRRWWIQGPSDAACAGVRNVAEVYDLKSAERQAANARLIAAAPDLLNMLQRMVDETSGGGKPCLLTLEQARAALEKARG